MRTEKYFTDIVRSPKGIPIHTEVSKLTDEEINEMLESGYAYVPTTKRSISKKHKRIIGRIEKVITMCEQ